MTKAFNHNTLNNTTVSRRHYQHNMQSKELLQTKSSKVVSNTKQHVKKPSRLVKLKILLGNGYGEKMEEKCDAITKAQEGCVTGDVMNKEGYSIMIQTSIVKTWWKNIIVKRIMYM